MKILLAAVVLLSALLSQGTAQSNFNTLECSVRSQQIFPFSGGSGYHFQETCEYELITTCSPDGSQQVPIHFQVDFTNENLEVGQFAIQWMNGIVIIGEGNSVSIFNAGGVTSSGNLTHSSVRFEAAGVIITAEKILETEPSFTITISSSSDILSQLCGLCGDRQGNLRLRNGQTVDPVVPQEVAMFVADFRVRSSDRIFQNTRQECVHVPNIMSTLILSTTITPTNLPPRTSVAASSEIEATSMSPSGGPKVPGYGVIIGVVVAAATVLVVVGLVIVAAVLIAWRVKRRGQGGRTLVGVPTPEAKTTIAMQDNPSYVAQGVAVESKSIYEHSSGISPPEAGTVVTMQDNPSYAAMENTVTMVPNPCCLAMQTNSNYESISGDGKASSGGNYEYI